MKNSLTLFLFLFAATAFAQTDFTKISTGSVEDCKAAEPQVLEAANLILSKPVNDAGLKDARSFLIRWMTSTEYTFTLDNHIVDMSKKKGNENLLAVFMACQAKYLLEHKDDAKYSDVINVGAYTLLADYIENTANGVAKNKETQKLLDAKKKGTIKDYVKGK